MFFGDIETGWRHDGEGEVDQDAGERAGNLNKDVWEEAARSWREGRLAGIFVSPFAGRSRAGIRADRRRSSVPTSRRVRRI